MLSGGRASCTSAGRRAGTSDRAVALDERVVPGRRGEPAVDLVGQLRRRRQDRHDARHRRDGLHERARDLHPKAIYIVEGRLYQVEKLDFEGRKAYVREIDCDYYTDAITYSRVTVLDAFGGGGGAAGGAAGARRGARRVARGRLQEDQVLHERERRVGRARPAGAADAHDVVLADGAARPDGGAAVRARRSARRGGRPVVRDAAGRAAAAHVRPAGHRHLDRAGDERSDDARPGRASRRPWARRRRTSTSRACSSTTTTRAASGSASRCSACTTSCWPHAELIAGCACDPGCPTCVGPVGRGRPARQAGGARHPRWAAGRPALEASTANRRSRPAFANSPAGSGPRAGTTRGRGRSPRRRGSGVERRRSRSVTAGGRPPSRGCATWRRRGAARCRGADGCVLMERRYGRDCRTARPPCRRYADDPRRACCRRSPCSRRPRARPHAGARRAALVGRRARARASPRVGAPTWAAPVLRPRDHRARRRRGHARLPRGLRLVRGRRLPHPAVLHGRPRGRTRAARRRGAHGSRRRPRDLQRPGLRRPAARDALPVPPPAVPFGARPHLDMLSRSHAGSGATPGRPAVVDGARPSTDSCALGALEEAARRAARGDVPGFEIPGRYFSFLRSGDREPLEPVLEHNRLDLVSLAVLTARALRLLGDAPHGAGARASLALAGSSSGWACSTRRGLLRAGRGARRRAVARR